MRLDKSIKHWNKMFSDLGFRVEGSQIVSDPDLRLRNKQIHDRKERQEDKIKDYGL